MTSTRHSRSAWRHTTRAPPFTCCRPCQGLPHSRDILPKTSLTSNSTYPCCRPIRSITACFRRSCWYGRTRDGWPGAVIPIEVNVVHDPLATAMRRYRLGQALRRAIESYPEDLSVVLFGTGALPHRIDGERTGYNDSEWDMRFIDLIEKDPMTLAKTKHVDYIRFGGAESVEVIMWLAMRGAISGDIKRGHQNCYLATTTAMTVLVFDENDRSPKQVARISQNPRLSGLEDIDGTSAFDIETVTKCIRFWNMRLPESRPAFKRNEAATCREAALTDREIARVRDPTGSDLSSAERTSSSSKSSRDWWGRPTSRSMRRCPARPSMSFLQRVRCWTRADRRPRMLFHVLCGVT
jgi:hypothetical protein